jgi:hypothetical protein
MWDALLNLHSANISGAGTTNGGAKFLGRNRTFRAWGRCAGDVTGAGASCVISLEESTNGSTGWAAIPNAGSLTVTEQVGVQGTTARPEIPSSVAVLPSLTFTPTKDYVRTSVVAGGTSPVFPGLTVNVEPLDTPLLQSGR